MAPHSESLPPLAADLRRPVDDYALRLCHAPCDAPHQRCAAFYMEVPAMRGVGPSFPDALARLEQLTSEAAAYLAARGETFPPAHERELA
jgi:hypothetical protein